MSTLDEASWQPLVQLVHVSDMHVKHASANPAHPLQARRRFIGRYLQHRGERSKSWDEGTQGHYDAAPASFKRFLAGWLVRDRAWQGKPVWLVDTGDLTAFGDRESIEAGRRYLTEWQEALGRCPVRTLFGNHDAWPGTQPAYAPDLLRAQRELIADDPRWDIGDWLANPLSIDAPDGSAAIELYALDSVCWTLAKNVRAVGEVDTARRAALVARMRIAAHGKKTFRILAMHHPVAFPWKRGEARIAGVVPQMRLLDEDAVARLLRNDANDPPGFGPLAHLILSGHTHLAHPAGGLRGSVVDVHQGLLGPRQLQLVGGSLMLNQSRTSAKQEGDGEVAPTAARDHDAFAPATVDGSRCQAQILRFSWSPEVPGTLLVMRIIVRSKDGTLYAPVSVDPILMTFDTP